MINAYLGTPGSGKTFHAVKDIHEAVKAKKHCITNILVNIKSEKYKPYYHYVELFEFSPEMLKEFALKYAKYGRENSVLCIIDEAPILFNPRDYGDKNRKDWLIFFSLHRHFYYEIILIAQMDRMLDRQVRGQIESQFNHRNAKRYKTFGWALAMLFGGAFIIVEDWAACKGLRLSRSLMVGNRKMYKSYNTFDMIRKEGEVASGNTGAGGTPVLTEATPTTSEVVENIIELAI